MPRAGKPPAAHPSPATATAKAQAQHHQAPNRFEEQTKNDSSTIRNKLTEFKPGFELTTEQELAAAFKRPVRKFKEDSPFYPWFYQSHPLYTLTLITKY